MDSEHNEGFQVKDRRRFNPDGTIREDAPSEQPPPQEQPAPARKEPGPTPPKKEDPPQPKPKRQAQDSGEFEIDFATFVLSLASSAQMALGAIPHPATGKPEVNPAAARQTIEILSMLEDKTKGNLDPQEEALFKHVLYDLRMAYVGLTQQANPSSQPKK